MERPNDEVGDMKVDEARERAFGPVGPDATWEQSGTGLVARKVALCVVQRVYDSSPIAADRPDIFVEVYVDIYMRFDHIWTNWKRSLAKAKRPATWTEFEKYLHASIRNKTFTVVCIYLRRAGEPIPKRSRNPKKADGEGENGGTDADGGAPSRRMSDQEVEQLPDEEEWTPLSLKFAEAILERITAEDRGLLIKRFLEGWTPAEIARTRGVSAKTISNQIYEAKRRLLQEMVRDAVSSYLNLHETLASETRIVVENRCLDERLCYFYSIDCGAARSAAEVAALDEVPLDKGELESRFEQLRDAADVAMQFQGLPVLLDQCLWETKKGRS